MRDHIASQVSYRQGAYLPHWTIPGATYHVVFRLADSLPAHVVEAFRNERELLRRRLDMGELHRPSFEVELRSRFSARIESVLDDGLGACWMRRPEVAELVLEAVKFFRGDRYELPAASVMPNHVHAVVTPTHPHELPEILNSWKGYSARMANRLLGRTGQFWQAEYYDHLIRDEADLCRTIDYVLANPSAAGLKNWPWTWSESSHR